MTEKEKWPQISVLMANYNKGGYIAEAIDSVMRQSFADWELLIADDGSGDNSAAVIEKFLSDGRVRFFRHDRNMGKVHRLKEMVGASRAGIVGILDSDDVLTDNALGEMVGAHREHPECGFIYSQFVYCDERLRPERIGYCRQGKAGESNIREEFVCAFRTYGKSVYERTAGYGQDIVYAEDKDIILKMEEVTKFHFVDKALYKYRVYGGSQSHDTRYFLKCRTDEVRAKYNAYRRRLGTDIPNLTAKEMSRVLYGGVIHSLRLRDWAQARYFASEAERLSLLNIGAYAMVAGRFIKFILRQSGHGRKKDKNFIP